MIYRNLCGHEVSQLGFGAMRLPVVDGQEGCPDEQHVFKMVDYAIEQGINYFDTAWGYHNGTSEAVMGRALGRYPRDTWYLASKFPGYDVGNFGKQADIFEKQLERAGVERFDFYLMHNVCELNVERYLGDERYGTVSYFVEQKKAGRIGHLGFSVHGNFDTFTRFLEVYGDVMEFCQIQLNYLDWDFQDAKAKVKVLGERGIPVIVMEPLRGGNLIALSDDEMVKLEALRPGKSPVDWAFRYLQGIPEVAVVLSGMSTYDQLVDNVGIFQTCEPLDEQQTAALYEIAAAKIAKTALPCTKCHCCVSHCPQELDIPWLIELYNEHQSREDGLFIAPMAMAALDDDKKPSACIGCGACEAVCPQNLPIPETFEKFSAQLGL